MRDAVLTEVAVFPPGTCFGCGGVEGPMVDTMVDVVGEGRIYVCSRICLPAWAGLLGYAEPDTMREVLEEAVRLSNEVLQLEGQLAYERDHKVVSVSDVLRLADRRAGVSTPVGLDPPRTCSATRVDGSPCQARAVPGRDVCIAHSKRTVAA